MCTQPASSTSQLPLLDVASLDVRFGSLRAVSEMSLSVRPGEAVALIGPNGAGKSTFINAVAGSVRAQAGTIRFRGQDVTRLSAPQRARLGMSRTFQTVELFGSMTVAENTLIAVEGAPRQRRRLLPDGPRTQVTRMLSKVGLADYSDRTVADLPLGVRKLAELARALVADPALLLLDEPAAGLSATDKEKFIDVLNVWRTTADRGLLVIEHDMDVVAGLADRVVVMEAGRFLVEGAHAQVSRDPAVIEAYLGQAKAREFRVPLADDGGDPADTTLQITGRRPTGRSE